MPALATVEDVLALGDADPARVTEAMLEQASARFRAAAGGHQISMSSYTDTFLVPAGETELPFRPVASIDQVLTVNPDGSDGPPLVGWTFDGKATLRVAATSGIVVNGPSFDDGHSGSVRVTWTAGYAEIPEDVRWAVAAMVSRAASTPAAGVTSEQLGDFSRSFGGYTASAAFSMSRDEQACARSYRPRRNRSHVLRKA